MEDNLPPNDFEADPIPADTIANLFCVGFKNAYQRDFAFETQITPHQIIAAILHDQGYHNEVAELEKAAETQDYVVECISNVKGGCFFHARYKKEDQFITFYIAANIDFKMSDNEKDLECNVQAESFIGGVEDHNGCGDLEFYPFITCGRAIVDDKGTHQLLAPANSDEFYTTLCYLQQCMATCLVGEKIDLKKNQAWFQPKTMATSYNEFVALLCKSTTQEVTDDYFLKFPEEIKGHTQGYSASVLIPDMFNRVLN